MHSDHSRHTHVASSKWRLLHLLLLAPFQKDGPRELPVSRPHPRLPSKYQDCHHCKRLNKGKFGLNRKLTQSQTGGNTYFTLEKTMFETLPVPYPHTQTLDCRVPLSPSATPGQAKAPGCPQFPPCGPRIGAHLARGEKEPTPQAAPQFYGVRASNRSGMGGTAPTSRPQSGRGRACPVPSRAGGPEWKLLT